MKLYITSSPGGMIFFDDGHTQVTDLDERNSFLENLRSDWKDGMRIIVICADPHRYNMNDGMVDDMKKSFSLSDFCFDSFVTCDYRNIDKEINRLNSYDLIILSGGHVPTENDFFADIHLKEKLDSYDGLIMGISAGSMNLADDVYAMPELEGEAVNPNFKRFIKGLAFSDYIIIPHYQFIRTLTLDGKDMIRDIACEDSIGRKMILLEDGSYIIKEKGENTLYGNAYTLIDGVIEQICSQNEYIKL